MPWLQFESNVILSGNWVIRHESQSKPFSSVFLFSSKTIIFGHSKAIRKYGNFDWNWCIDLHSICGWLFSSFLFCFADWQQFDALIDYIFIFTSFLLFANYFARVFYLILLLLFCAIVNWEQDEKLRVNEKRVFTFHNLFRFFFAEKSLRVSTVKNLFQSRYEILSTHEGISVCHLIRYACWTHSRFDFFFTYRHRAKMLAQHIHWWDFTLMWLKTKAKMAKVEKNHTTNQLCFGSFGASHFDLVSVSLSIICFHLLVIRSMILFHLRWRKEKSIQFFLFQQNL